MNKKIDNIFDETNKVRIFIAVKPTIDFYETIPSHLLDLEKIPTKDLRLVKKENLHLTIKFLGFIEQALAKKICRDIDSLAKQFKPFTAKIETASFFPKKHAKVYACILESHPILQKIFSQSEKFFENYGFEHSPHLFNPHISLARLQKDHLQKNFNVETEFEMKIDNLTVFESQSTETGVSYVPLKISYFKK